MEKMLSGTELISDVDNCHVGQGQCCLWWLGQQSFIVKFPKKVLYLDLFLTPLVGRMIKPFLIPQDVKNADFFLGSHDHADHIDRPVWPILANTSPDAHFIVPELLREQLIAELNIPAERFIGLDDSASYTDKEIRITAIAAAHEFLDRDEKTGHYPYLGYIIESNGCKIYHAGDTCNYEGLQSKLKPLSPDIMLLPINGRDAKRLARSCIGNMTYQEAADLAGVCKPCLVIPTHYDMFATNTEDPMLFTDYMKVKYPHVNVHLCKYAERVIVSL
jgi:L-ascorbate metabolism protein UlaG (beta-lactamase superfamily)